MDPKSSNPIFIDSHCHLPLLKETVESILGKCLGHNLVRILNVGYDKKSSEESVELTRYDLISATVGIHPHYVGGDLAADMQWLRKICKNSSVEAIGEIGLDYVKSSTSRELQIEWFEAQLEVAKENNLPVVIHNRSADEDIERILSHHDRIKGVLHCYSSGIEFGKKMLEMGWFLSFSGNITYPKSDILRQMVKDIPAGRILLETDAPYLTPMPYRGKKENSPLLMPDIYDFVALLRGENRIDLSKQITENYSTLFGKKRTNG